MTPEQQTFIELIKKGKLQQVKAFSAAYPTLLTSPLDDDGYYAIHIAAEAGYLEIVQYFIQENHTLLNQTTKFGHTAIMIAAYSAPPQKELSEKMSVAGVLSWFAPTPDHINDTDHPGVIRYLIAQGADLSQKINNPEGPYHNYLIYDLPLKTYISDILFENTAMYSSETFFYAVRAAGSSNRLDWRSLLLLIQFLDSPAFKIAVFSYQDIHGKSLWDYVSPYSSEEAKLFRFIQDNIGKIKIHERPIILQGLSNVKYSMEELINEKLMTLRMLLEVNSEASESEMACIQSLFISLFRCVSNPQIISFEKFLIDTYPVLLNATDDKNQTLLMLAVKGDKADLADYLIAKGANQALISSDGETVSSLAAQYYPALLKKLNDKDFFGTDVRIQKGKHLIHLLSSHATDEMIRLEFVMELLSGNKALLDITDDVGKTPLFYAAECGFITAVEYFITLKPNLNATINDPQSSLHGLTVIGMLQHNHTSDKNALITAMLIQAGASKRGLCGGLLLTARPFSLAHVPGTLHYQAPDRKPDAEPEIKRPAHSMDDAWNW